MTVRPATFRLVDFDPVRIRTLVAEVADAAGLPADVELDVEVDEATPFGRVTVTITGRLVHLAVEGGAFEDPKQLRRLSESGSRQVLGRLLHRVADRLDPAFGDPPPDGELTLAQHTAWDAYAAGRYARRAGIDGGQARRRYAFRLRHGFSDAADTAFDRLWWGDGLSWADVEAISRDARGVAGGA